MKAEGLQFPQRIRVMNAGLKEQDGVGLIRKSDALREWLRTASPEERRRKLEAIRRQREGGGRRGGRGRNNDDGAKKESKDEDEENWDEIKGK